MSHEHSRRSSTVAFSASDAVPDAPPLPNARPLQRARDAAGRLFGYQSRPVSPQRSPEEDRFLRGPRSRYASLSTTQNATASHRTGLEINTLAINEQGTQVLLAGKDIFKTVRVEDGKCTEEVNLRSAIRRNPLQASGKTRQIYSIDIADVAWAKGDCSNLVAAATSSGRIILYDLGYSGLQAAQLHEHFRQVHNVTFNPHKGSLLLSGSQDGTVRLWDVKEARQASTIHSKRKYSGLSDGVRDVKWSPTEGVDFAFGTDSGWIQLWDMRNLKSAKLKIPAHGESCNTIDWHPDGKHIVSASSDLTVRVWDFSSYRRQKASWEIKTPYPVFNARWRPMCESSMSFDNDARLCTQLVTAYDPQHPVLHVWDFRRPALPFREIAPLHSAPTDLIWHSQDLLWSVGREGTFIQSDIQHAPKILEKRNLQTCSISPQGEINFVTQERRQHRPRKRRSLPALTPMSSNLTQSPDHSFLSRSWADDSLDHSFLSALPTKRAARSASHSRALSISSTADSYEHRPVPMLTLDDVLLNRKSFKPRQTACRGLLPGSREPEIFRFLAQRYRSDIKAIAQDEEFLKGFEGLLQHNERCAEYVALYRLAQTWKILNFTMTNHLRERAETKITHRKEHKSTKRISRERSTFKVLANEIMNGPDRTYLAKTGLAKPTSTLTQQLNQVETGSDQRTPLARPVLNENDIPSQIGDNLLNLENDQHLALRPLVSTTQAEENVQMPQQHDGSDKRLTCGNLSDLQKLQPSTEVVNKAAMVQIWSADPRKPLDLEPPQQGGVGMSKLEKHDSSESFTFLEGSFDSREHSFPSSFNSNGSGRLDMVAERPSRMVDKSRRDGDDFRTEAVDFSRVQVNSKGIPIVQSGSLPGRPNTNGVVKDIDAQSNEEPALEILLDDTNGYDYGLGSYPDENGLSHFAEPSLLKRQAPDFERGSRVLVSPRSAVTKAAAKDDTPVERPTSDSLPKRTATDPETSVYFPTDDGDNIETDKPFQLVDMLRELVSFYADNGDAQTAAHILLLLKPLLPRTHALLSDETVATVSVYADYFTAAGYTQSEIETILHEHFEPDIRAGLQPLQIEAILATYQDGLTTRRLFNEAAMLRKLAFPACPAVYDQAVKDSYFSLSCGECGKPISSGMSKLRCESCCSNQARCSVCWCHHSPYEVRLGGVEGMSKLLSTCLLCNHSSHAACLRIWFDDTAQGDGACPSEGCLCDCVAGTWRSQKMQVAERRRRHRSHERVQSDEWPAKESKAVERTRAVLGVKSRRGSRLKLRA